MLYLGKINIKQIIILSIICIVFLFNEDNKCFGQSLIAGIPNADVAEKKHIELTHESQVNFWTQTEKWTSFNFLCYGIGYNSELTATLNNLDNKGSKNLVLGGGFKKVFPFLNQTSNWENKIIVGANALYSLTKYDMGFWTYGLYSFRYPTTKTRLTMGLAYGTSHVHGFTKTYQNNMETEIPNNTSSILFGFEQPIYKNFSVIADYYSGTHDISSLISAIQIDIGHHVIIVGYKLPNDLNKDNPALIFEVMLNL